LKIEELADPDVEQILIRAEERLENAIFSVSVDKKRENYLLQLFGIDFIFLKKKYESNY
jgi:hypothetical protein